MACSQDAYTSVPREREDNASPRKDLRPWVDAPPLVDRVGGVEERCCCYCCCFVVVVFTIKTVPISARYFQCPYFPADNNRRMYATRKPNNKVEDPQNQHNCGCCDCLLRQLGTRVRRGTTTAAAPILCSTGKVMYDILSFYRIASIRNYNACSWDSMAVIDAAVAA